MAYLEAQRRDLADLAERSRARRLSARTGRDFASNDYLALAGDPALAGTVRAAIEAGVPIGSGGSRLLRGNHVEHERLEAAAAGFFGAESALYFSTGYAANAALLSTLPQRGDLIVHDALVHASAHEGMRLSRAEARGAAHNDPDAFDDAVAAWRAGGGTGRVWVAVESLYSMDGDRAPLDALAEIADRHEAILLVDEAHATGVFGPEGRGLAAGLAGSANLITLHTCGKALGCEGALLCGPRVMRDFLVNRGRAFIFSTAPSPLMAVAVEAALGLIARSERRERLHELVGRAEALLAPVGVRATGSQILPLVLGDDARTMAMAAELQRLGFDVRGIRPPTVPAGTSRLRISLTLNVDEADVAALAEAIGSLA
ncbi:MAG TPA: 8-amino-7-oxononanoate synthase [Sphingomonas sp.]|nr:8-amino-7-oxononanoate synthase [Sphingomonas sp.]